MWWSMGSAWLNNPNGANFDLRFWVVVNFASPWTFLVQPSSRKISEKNSATTYALLQTVGNSYLYQNANMVCIHRFAIDLCWKAGRKEAQTHVSKHTPGLDMISSSLLQWVFIHGLCWFCLVMADLPMIIFLPHQDWVLIFCLNMKTLTMSRLDICLESWEVEQSAK